MVFPIVIIATMKRSHLVSLLFITLVLLGCSPSAPLIEDQVVIIPSVTPTPAVPLPTNTPESFPTIDMTCDEPEINGFRLSMDSKLLGGSIDYTIFLPSCDPFPMKQFPVLYLFHGMVPGSEVMNDSQWYEMGIDETLETGMREGYLPPMIIVLPDGNDMQYEKDDGLFVRVFVDEFIPTIDNQFCTLNEQQYRAIGGLSRGGFWALSAAFQYPELFVRVGGHSPFLYDGPDYPENNPFNLVDSGTGFDLLEIAIDHGAEDFTAPNTADFIMKLNSRSLNPIYIVNAEGVHDESYWRAHLLEYLEFYAGGWPLAYDDYPNCERG